MIRKNKNGTYSVRVGPSRQRTFDRKRDADEYEAQLKQDHRRGRAGMHTDPGAITYAALAELYLDTYDGKSKAWVASILTHSIKRFGKMHVRSIRPDDIAAWMKSLTGSYAASTRSHILTYTRTVLDLGVEWHYLDKSPATSRFIESPGRKRATKISPFESWAEVLAVAEQAGRYGPLVRFVCATGLRPGEWIELRWSDLDTKAKNAHVRGTKTKGSNRMIPLSKNALAAIADMPTPIDKSQRVFQPAKGGAISLRPWRDGPWTRALFAAGVEKRVPYQMRHTFATLGLEAGVPLEAISKLMGHEGIEVTIRFYIDWTRPMIDNARSILDTIGEKGDEDASAASN